MTRTNGQSTLKIFADLYDSLKNTSDVENSASLLLSYFKSDESSLDKNVALNLFLGNYPKRILNLKQLNEWAPELTGFHEWLIERSENEVGNFIQTLSLLLRADSSRIANFPISHWILTIEELLNSPKKDLKAFIKNVLSSVDEKQRLILLKLLSGTFKSPITKREITNCFAQLFGIQSEIISLRIYACEKRKSVSISDLKKELNNEYHNIPLKFPEIISIDSLSDSQGAIDEIECSGKKDGIEVQVVNYENSSILWTKENEIISEKFPEIISSFKSIKTNFVIYGQILPANPTLPLEKLVSRIDRKSISKKDVLLTEAEFVIWDVLEGDKKEIQKLISSQPGISFLKTFNLSSRKELSDLHKKCHEKGFSGILLKQKTENRYYFWKANSHTINAVILYVEFVGITTSGINSLTFGARNGNEFVPIAKLSKIEENMNTSEIIDFVKTNTVERFGPVRTIKPQFVYQLYFDGINKSSRTKSGIKLVNPKINRALQNNLNLVNDLEYLHDLLKR